MASLWQRIIGAPLAPPPEVKAQTGPGWISMATLPMLSSLSKRPEKLMAEAEALFHTAPWVAEAERVVSGRMGRVSYHLEDAEGDTLTRADGPLVTSLLDAIDHPSTNPRRSRRQLWSLTGRHQGLTGNGFWYLDQRELLGGTPLQTLYINPARMTPADDEGGNLLGWIMDHPQNPLTPQGMSPTPFELKEIIHFVLDEPDYGHYGIGIPESAWGKIELSRLTDRHAAITIASGGRLAGILSPKSGVTISDDGWQAIVRDYRTIVDDPDSAKRLQVMRSPVDFAKTSADPTELQLVELAHMSRDDIFALWGIPLSQVGIVSARGLNSGETPKFEEAALWQGPIEERLFGFREKVQTEFVDLWKGLGLEATLVLETPTFDDQAPLFVNAEKAKALPLTNDERRDLIGLDPLEDEAMGDAVYIDQTMVPLNAPAAAPSQIVNPPTTEQPIPVKATALETLRHRIEITWEPRIRAKVAEVLAAQKDEVAARVFSKHAHLVNKPADSAMWWNTEKERERLSHALEPIVLAMARDVAHRAEEKVPRDLRPSKAALDAGYLDTLSAFLRTRVGERIVGITDTTRDKIAAVVESGVAQGLSPIELSKTIQSATAFDEARSEMVSRTETMFAYNDAALSTYRELGASIVQAIDGDQDEECAARDGREFTVDEAYNITDHPNGTLDWIPIVPSKALVDERPHPAYWAGLEAIAKAASLPIEIPAPIVNVAAPPAPQVVVNTDSFARALDGITALLNKPKPKPILERDGNGRIVGISYE